ncbi:1-phosphofructokinase [Endozoicomonas arenosclerae]|uniref:1-phosphofructokinase n=1 Tax=Endozoicomonas arenosclerae TaxID=1633495 RepID=UPI0007854F01|nr:1-phosphofructokinase [Endozoicomonas arenosclerae]
MIVTVTLNPAKDQTVQLEKLHVDAVNAVDQVVETMGGKGINVARVLSDLGADVLATGLMGDKDQSLFQEYLDKYQVQTQFVTLEGSVRSNIKLVDRSTEEVTDINFPGFNASDSDLDTVLQVIRAQPGISFVAVCGSLPPGISLNAFETFLQSIKELGFKLAVDTSGKALDAAIRVKPDLIKPNLSELSDWAEQAMSQEEAVSLAAELSDAGISDVVLSCGADGAWFVHHDQAIKALPGKVKVVSTVGAGDSMMAACLFGITRELPRKDWARLATACGMKAVSQPGVGECSEETLMEYLASVEVIEVGNKVKFAGAAR